ncbi:response regulator receiver domain [Shewanella algae]|uniref:response regulator receiver domain n=1 Tax=Shewanella algae TaxID=38313 RepID=UPI001320564B|nr:response regulator receiver domain [Shewanella algae]QHD53498.1 hypothetical protein GM320_10215 [Shewanella algae]
MDTATVTTAEIDSALSPEKIWSDHCLNAVKKFIKNAVVIDNEPVLSESSQRPESLQLSPPVSTGMGDQAVLITPHENGNAPMSEATDSGALQETDTTLNTLDVRLVTDAFVDAGIACSFVLPSDSETDEDSKVRRVLAAAKLADMVVIDWYLYDSSPNLTIKVLRKLAEADLEEAGRLRLIAVYTSQDLTTGIFSDIKDSLKQGGLTVEDVPGTPFMARNASCLVIALNKKEVIPSDLPSKLINSFTVLADGLIPSFALAAVGAIRKNMHHLVTRFSKELDTAYISNRLITNPPGDVAELMRDLLVAEFDSAIGLESIADDYLDNAPVLKWINKSASKISSKEYNVKDQRGDLIPHKVDISFLSELLIAGIEDEGFTPVGENSVFKPFPTRHRHLVSVVLAGSDEVSKSSQSLFSRLVAFKREAFNSAKLSGSDEWLPSLTTGTLLKHSNGKYFLCLTPACDTLRLKGSSSFVFLEAITSDKKYSLVLKDNNGADLKLKFERKRPKLSTFVFSPDETQRVRGEWHTGQSPGENGQYKFQATGDGNSFTWLGEIRYGRAASEMAQLVGNWMRIGINDSEFLRLIDAGKISG